MLRTIAVVTTNGRGGVATAINKLCRGLRLEGFDVRICLLGNNLLRAAYKDALLMKSFAKFDAVIYMNSTPAPDYVINRVPIKAIFIHGLIDEEIVNSVRHANLSGKIRSLFTLIYREALKLTGPAPDFYIYQSESMRMANYCDSDSVVLPQYILPSEIKYFQTFVSKLSIPETHNFTILTYFPLVESSRLLRTNHIIKLAELLTYSLKREFQIIIVGAPFTGYLTDRVKVMDFLHRDDFLNLLASSDLYIERCTDEELGYTALEAGLLGVPVAKITRQSVLGRCDYSNEQVINSTSLKGLAEQISDYCSGSVSSPYKGPKNMKEWLIGHRSWDAVKRPLLRRLTEYSN